MTALTTIFNNRELATLTWIVVLVVAGAIYRPTRGALASLTRAFRHRLILISLGIASVYIAGCVWVMAWRGLWTTDNLKTTIVWAITVAFCLMANGSRVTEDRTFFTRAIRDTVNFTAVLVFIVEFYSFSYGLELLAIAVLAFLQLLQLTAERDPAARPVNSLLKGVLSAVGLLYIGSSLYQTAVAPNAFFTVDNAREFLVPIVLSALFLPFLYLFGVYAAYEQNFIPVSFAIPEASLRRYAQRQAVLRFRTNLDALRRWQRLIQRERPVDRAGIDAAFDSIQTVQARDAHPAPVSPSQRWSPYAATKYLSDHGLAAGDYHRAFEEEWFASAPLLALREAVGLANNLGYYVDGTEYVATALKLKLYVNEPDHADTSHARFRQAANTLIEQALGPGTPPVLADELDRLAPFKRALPNGGVSLIRERWPQHPRGGYEIMLEIDRRPGVPR